MKTFLRAVAMLAISYVALSAQSASDPSAAASPTPLPIQNVMVKLQGNLVLPDGPNNLPIDVTLAPASGKSVILSRQSGNVTMVDGSVQPITEEDAIFFMNDFMDAAGNYRVTYYLQFHIPQNQAQTGRVTSLTKNIGGTVLVKLGETMKVLDAPGSGSLQLTFTKGEPAANRPAGVPVPSVKVPAIHFTGTLETAPLDATMAVKGPANANEPVQVLSVAKQESGYLVNYSATRVIPIKAIQAAGLPQTGNDNRGARGWVVLQPGQPVNVAKAPGSDLTLTLTELAAP